MTNLCQFRANHALTLLARVLWTISLPLAAAIVVQLLSAASAPVVLADVTASSKSLDVYFIDVEGGQATLFVAPEGQSLLIDTGWPGFDGRDAARIAAAARIAGRSKIDFVLLTHYHTDHAGGASQLLAKMPVGTFIDHGENREPGDAATAVAWENYRKLFTHPGLKRMVAHVGDLLPIAGLRAQVISSDGAVPVAPLPGAGADSSACLTTERRAADQTENARSLGIMVTVGAVRILDLGDLTWDKELELVCPRDKLGPVDVYIVSHHGWSQSNSPALLAAIAPRLAIMDNGEHKGGSPSAWDTVKNSPRLEDLWQLHHSAQGGTTHNSNQALIANLPGPDAANFLKLSVWPSGAMTMYNSRTGLSKHYAAKHGL